MSSYFLGEIRLFAGNFAPKYWAMCNGQILSIAQNTALFSLLGTTYGGNGTTTFALPDFRSRVPLGQGQGPGLSPRDLGEIGGTESVTLLIPNLPVHTHVLNALSGNGTQTSPASALWAAGQAQYSSAAPNAALHPLAGGLTGGSQPHPNMPPVLALTFIIALSGIYPSRN